MLAVPASPEHPPRARPRAAVHARPARPQPVRGRPGRPQVDTGARLRHRDRRGVCGASSTSTWASSCLSDRVALYELATAGDDGRVNRRTVRALVVVLGTIGILFAGSGVASAEPAAQSQSRASEPGCVWFWWIDRWICRDVDDPPPSGQADAGDGDQPDARRTRASDAERGQRAGPTADPPPTRGTADDSDGGDARRTERREGASG
jgi:hypothetical protein